MGHRSDLRALGFWATFGGVLWLLVGYPASLLLIRRREWAQGVQEPMVTVLVPRLLADLRRADVRASEGTIDALRAHLWPGNVRELKNVISCALAFVEGSTLEPRHLRFTAPAADDSALERLPLGGHSLQTIERAAIRQTLLAVRGNKVQAARTLGIAPSTLYEKLRKYGLV